MEKPKNGFTIVQSALYSESTVRFRTYNKIKEELVNLITRRRRLWFSEFPTQRCRLFHPLANYQNEQTNKKRSPQHNRNKEGWFHF